MRRHCEGQAQIHAAGVVLDRSIDELLDLRKGDDLIEVLVDLFALHTKDRAVEKDILTSGQLRMEAGANLQQRANPPKDVGVAGCRLGDSRENLKQRALARAVPANDPDDLAALDLE